MRKINTSLHYYYSIYISTQEMRTMDLVMVRQPWRQITRQNETKKQPKFRPNCYDVR